MFDKNGKLTPVTLIVAGPCYVLQKKNKEKEGYDALQVGYRKIEKKDKIGKSMKGKEYKDIKEYIGADENLKVGDEINVSTFEEGRYCKSFRNVKRKRISGRSKKARFSRKKRNSRSKTRTKNNWFNRFKVSSARYERKKNAWTAWDMKEFLLKDLKIMKVDKDSNLLVLKGAVPGRTGALLEIRGIIMKFDLYNQNGEVSGSVTLPKEIFEVEFNADLVHQIAVSLMANKRQISAHTKNRGEVRGGGKKPWRQKGTGRARVGSNRSPIWKGGGITHGPRNDRIFAVEIPKKMRRKALLMVLSEKAKSNNLIVLDKFDLEKGKTKEMALSLSKLPCKNTTTLIAMPDYDKKVFLSARNIKKTDIDDARNLNVLDLLNHKYLLLTKDSIKTIEKTFVNITWHY